MKPTLFVVRADDPTADSEFVYRSICLDRGTNDFDAALRGLLAGNSIRLGVDQIVAVGGRRSLSTAFGHIPVQNYTFDNVTGGQLFMTTSRSAPARAQTIKAFVADASNFLNGPMGHLTKAIERHDYWVEKFQRPAETSRSTYNPGRAPTAVNGVQPPPPTPVATPTVPSVGQYFMKFMKDTYHPKVIANKVAVYEEGIKEKTVVRIIPAPAGFNGIQLGPSISGAGICLRLRAHFNV